MKLRYAALAVLSLTLVSVAPLHVAAQERTGSHALASPSTASGQSSEPVGALNENQKEEKDPAEALKAPSPVVARLGGMLGMSPQASIWVFNWLNFAILAVAVIFVAMRMIPKAFRTRTEGIQKHIVDARTATEAANSRLSAVEARLAKLDDEIAAIRAESDRESAEEEARTKQQIADETERILKSAEQEIAAASAQAQRNLRAYAADIAVDRAASRLQISEDDDRMLIQNFAAKLGEGSTN